VSQDGLHQIRGSAIVQEKRSLTEAPQGSCTKFVRTGIALGDTVGEPGSHMVNGKIGE